jgi:chlorobactene glucosyltransferase
VTLAGHEAGIVVFLGLLLLISLGNLLGLHRLRDAALRHPQAGRVTPRVSILVPARNEETKIEVCVRSLLAQDYPDFEIVVLNDSSEDRTADRVQALCFDPRLRLLHGAPLPRGWLGKNWACQQLGTVATGDILLFTDADTRHQPQALRDAVCALDGERVDFLSVLPEQEMHTWGERLVVPILPWSQQTFYPIALLRRGRAASLTTAIGQYMMFRRSTYLAVGGFERVRDSVIDDGDLVRAVARHGSRWTLLDGTGRVTCRMYDSFHEAADGLSKNLFARFRCNFPVFAFVWTWLLWVTWQPPIFLLLWATGSAAVPPAVVAYAATATGLSFLLWLVSDLRFRIRLDHAAIAPLTILATFGIAARSVAWRLLGRGTWKSRPLTPRLD